MPIDIPGATRLPKCPCPFCGHTLDAASGADGSDDAPTEGDATVCIQCAEVLFIRADLTLRVPEPGELITMLFKDPAWAQQISDLQRRIRAVRDIMRTIDG